MWQYQIMFIVIADDDGTMTIGNYDRSIVNGSVKLLGKFGGNPENSPMVQVSPMGLSGDARAQATAFFRKIAAGGKANQTRVYIRGHGDFVNQKVGRIDAEGWVDILRHAGMPRVGLISVTGCNAGLQHNGSSFATHFHRILREKTGYTCDVVARTQYVAIMPNGSKRTSASIAPGQMNFQHQAPGSKIKLTWNGTDQVSTNVY